MTSPKRWCRRRRSGAIAGRRTACATTNGSARRPERFVVLGDAACAFNPAYGQGMTVAAMNAATLHRCLRAQRAAKPDGSLVGFPGRFQRELARDLRVPWLMATGEDFRHPTTEGPRPGAVEPGGALVLRPGGGAREQRRRRAPRVPRGGPPAPAAHDPLPPGHAGASARTVGPACGGHRASATGLRRPGTLWARGASACAGCRRALAGRAASRTWWCPARRARRR